MTTATRLPFALRWPRRWNVLALTLLGQAVTVGIQTFCFAFWVVPWLEDFKAPRSELMLIITVSVLMTGAIAPFGGILLDRFPIRAVFCFGATVFALALFLISVMHSFWLVLLLYGCVLPVGIVLAGPLASQTLITRWFPTNRGTALGISALGHTLGACLPPLVTLLIAAYGWRGTFQWLAAASFLLLVPFAWIVLRRAPDGERAPSRIEPRLSGPTAWTTWRLLANPDFRIIAFGFFAMMFAYLPILYGVGAFAHDLGIPQQQAAWAALATSIALALGNLGFGKLADLLEHRSCYWLCAASMAAGVGVASLAHSTWMLVIGLFIAAFGMGGYSPLLPKMIGDRMGIASFGQATGLAMLLIQLSAVAPSITGALRDHGIGYTPTFLMMLVLLLPAALAMRWLSPRAGPASAALSNQAASLHSG